MPLPRYAAKRDAVEREIVQALEQCGFSVYRMNQPLDLLVGFRRKGLWLVEVKSGAKAKLNENQREFVATWKGPKPVILRSAQDAIDWAVEVASGMEKAA